MPFTNIIKPPASDGTPYPCPCCGETTLPERGANLICSTCGWEDDGQDDHDADQMRGGPNGNLSLTQARQAFRKRPPGVAPK